MFRSNTLIVD